MAGGEMEGGAQQRGCTGRGQESQGGRGGLSLILSLPLFLSLSLSLHTSLQGKLPLNPLGPYSRPMPRALWWSWGVGLSYERGTPVLSLQVQEGP